MQVEEKIMIRHNIWLDDELTRKSNSLTQMRRAHNDLETDTSLKLAYVSFIVE